ncbi:MAG: Lrp/AsnC family transcriptional regulator [Mycobacterium sp.]
MPTRRPFDRIDVKLMNALIDNPRETTIGLAHRTSLSRNTVQARLSRWEELGVLRPLDRRIDPAALGYPLRAYVFTTVEQRQLDRVSAAMRGIPEVIAVEGLSGDDDLLIQVVARDADDLYRIAGRILDLPGVQRTRTGLVMRELLDYRLSQLLTI